MKNAICAAALLSLLTNAAVAQEKDSSTVNSLNEVVVTDTKFAQSKAQSGKVIEVISAKDLAKKSGQSLANILSQVAGLEINGNQSAQGKNLGYYIRGGKNNQVLILIDGVPLTDASGISFEYDLRLLPIEQVERIEIMKGAASTLYGTGAATGVINITLKKNAQKPIQGGAYLNYGTNNTAEAQNLNSKDLNGGLSLNGQSKSKKINYLASYNGALSDGMSQIASPYKDINYEPDRFQRSNLLAKFGFHPNENLSLDFFGNYDKIANDYDGVFDHTNLNDIKENKTTSKQFRFGFLPKFKYKNGELVMNSGFTKITRDYDELNTYTNQTEHTVYQSQNLIFDGFNKYNFSEEVALILGLTYQFYNMNAQSPYDTLNSQLARFDITDVYGAFVYNAKYGLNINTGARLNHHSVYGNNFVWNANLAYHLETNFPFKIIASYSTAFITPSLYQLYAQYGNLQLKPEKDATIEAGFETAILNGKLKWNVVAFSRKQSNTIGFDASYHYANIDGSNRARGLETSIKAALDANFQLNGNYTFTKVDQALDRLIPKHKINVGLDFQASNQLFFNLAYQYLSARNDLYFDGISYTIVPVKLKSYQVLNLMAKYNLPKQGISVFGTVTNIFNEQFVENIGYATRGRNFKIGLHFSF